MWGSARRMLLGSRKLRCSIRVMGGGKIGVCIVGTICGGIHLSGHEPGERGCWCVWSMAKMGISWSFVLTQYSKFASFVRVWCLLTTKGLDTCVGSQMDLCYPVLIRRSPICLAFAVSTKPLSSRCGQGSCYPEPVAVWNRGWHIRALGALSFWGSVAGPSWVIVIRGRGSAYWMQ